MGIEPLSFILRLPFVQEKRKISEAVQGESLLHLELEMAEFAFLIKQSGENNIHTTDEAYAIVERDKLSARRKG